MFRRKFLQMVTAAGVGTLASLEAAVAEVPRTVTYLVKGFSCVTCATGLDTLLSRQKGILSSQSTYPEGKVTVRFDSSQITEPSILAFIAELGFTVKDRTKPN